jgi:phosphoglycolate phosphatase-like HAD superfamily hydrolase
VQARKNNLPWDTVFGGDIFDIYKPCALHMRNCSLDERNFRNPRTFLGATRLLGLPPHEVAMVAAHIDDLRAAASHGLCTVYLRRLTEDIGIRETVSSKAQGGEVDVVVDSLLELAEVLESYRGS